ncbi:MAG: hypothetical protein JWL64_2055 [Frankiales bacterium]|nr:hypothetical protein [Frankiales bacterium]
MAAPPDLSIVRRPLAVTDDPGLLDDMIRLAAAGGTELDVAPDALAARRWWAQAPFVAVGLDQAEACTRAGLPRRSRCAVVAADTDDTAVWQHAVALGAEQVVLLPDGAGWLVDRFADAAEAPATDGVLLAVLGGRGGAGASVLAAALVRTAARLGHRTLLVDADPLGGGVDLVLGCEDTSGLRWPALTGSRGRVPSAALADALPRADGVAVLSWDRDSPPRPVPVEAMDAVLRAGRRAHDLVVVDLPRHLEQGALAAAELATTVLLVVPAEVRAAASAGRVLQSLEGRCHDVRLVVRTPGPGGLDGRAVAEALGIPLALELGVERDLDVDLERGSAPGRRGRGVLTAAATRLLGDVLPDARAAA